MKHSPKADIGPIEALRKLIGGNDRFAKGLRTVDSFPSCKFLQALSKSGQRPIGMVLACSDSRVPTEVIFDQRMGDLFVIRVAGNVVTPLVLSSMEYASKFLGTELCVVLGHSGCGAVKAAVQVKRDSQASKLSPAIKHLVEHILPAVPEKRDAPDRLLNLAIQKNVSNGTQQISRKSLFLADRIRQGKLLVINGVFDIGSGKVTFDIPVKLQPLLKLSDVLGVREIPKITIRGD